MPNSSRILGILTATMLWTVAEIGAANIPSRPSESVRRARPPVVAVDEPERREVRRMLASFGLDRSQIEQRLSRLTSADILHLSKNPGQLQAGGGDGVPSRAWRRATAF